MNLGSVGVTSDATGAVRERQFYDRWGAVRSGEATVGDGGCKQDWVQPLALAWNRGYRPHELSEIERLIETNHALIERAWQEAASRQ